MKKHLVLMDLDGTLLDREKKVSKLNKKAIKEIVKQGHVVVIATGRAHYRSHMIYDELELDTILVNRNANHIHSPKDQTFQENIQFIPKHDLKKILDFKLNERDEIKSLYFENKNAVHVLKGDNKFYSQYKLCKIIKQIDYAVNTDVNVISMFVKNESVQEITSLIHNIDSIQCDWFNHDGRFEHTFIQIYPKNTDKCNAINLLNDYYGIKQEHTIAIGDQMNDLKMIKNAGTGVAMGNANKSVKEVADIVLKQTNNESAVGLFLSDYFNLEIS
ncbi:Cof-type HAD-IIB family hydrolase [Haloplasma contractile]|uniref:Phosphoserine phosphatase protein n=1 Tax=Haloplasma contractile SSD-17B TaxID=1033810 RepID=U2DSV7_9MOLU|nr:Cof-type HAD-IIB family hydrolase [Haloplasma contractile]ERJ11577.1 phosphoserine phosphatase protein [Haloplasma contractile SSD-17B]